MEPVIHLDPDNKPIYDDVSNPSKDHNGCFKSQSASYWNGVDNQWCTSEETSSFGVLSKEMEESENAQLDNKREDTSLRKNLMQKSKTRVKVKRAKERTIREIINKVADWRRLYLGVHDATNKKHTLEEAAALVNIPKKTLDDYLLIIQAGRRLGFDFNLHSGDKVGVLRTFIKRCKQDNDSYVD